MEIIHLERQVLVWNKPAGVETQDEEALQLLREEINAREGRTGTPYIHTIHRLDQPTSGIVVLARSSKALSKLQASLRERKAEKFYLAWIEGEIEEEGRFVDHLVHASHHAKLDDDGKASSLNYRVIQREKGKSLVLIELETGRYHQIRIQFSSRGHSILGDVKYGAKKWKGEGIALHHYFFKVPHPAREEVLQFQVIPPASFGKLPEWLKEPFQGF